MIAPIKMVEVHILRRGPYYDIFIDNKKVGSGTWAYVNTAVYFYTLEGMRVMVHDE